MRYLEKLYAAHYADILKCAYFFCNDLSAAEDISQEVFIKFHKNYGEKCESQLIENERGLLFAICRTQSLNYLKKRKHTVYVNPENLVNMPYLDAFQHEFELKEAMNHLIAILKTKKAIYVQVFLLKMEFDLSTEDIAKTVKKSSRTIRRILAEIRDLLKKIE